MTPPAATAAARAGALPRPPRRLSGPARGATRAGGGVAPASPLGLRLLRGVLALPDARVVDRISRGRLWIALLGVGLVGIVFLQISLLQVNTGISRAVVASQTLEQQNTGLKLELSRLAGGERVEDAAAAMGFVVPATGQPRFLDARRSPAARAAAAITAPDPIAQLPLGMISPSQGGTAGLAPPVAATGATGAVAAAPAGAGTAATATPAGSGAAAPVTPATTTAATTTPTPTAQAASPPAVTSAAPATTAAPATAAAPVPATAAAGGASAGTGG